MLVDVVLKVNDEVKAVGDALVKECQDIEAKVGIPQQGADLFAGLSPVLGTIAQLPADVKASADNRAYLEICFGRMVETFIKVGAAPKPAA